MMPKNDSSDRKATSWILRFFVGLFPRQKGKRLKGTVKWFSNQKGYGFITTEDGKDIFVHHSSIQGEGYHTLRDGQAVEFEITRGTKGEQASHVIKCVSKGPGGSPRRGVRP